MKTIVSGLLFAIFAGVVGYLGYGFFYYHNQYDVRTSELQRSYAAVNQKVLRYGVIKSIDKNARVIEINTLNPFEFSTDPLTLTLSIPSGAFIARQELASSSGIITSVSSTTQIDPADLSPLTPGTRVKFLVQLSGTTTPPISYILFGYPL